MRVSKITFQPLQNNKYFFQLTLFCKISVGIRDRAGLIFLIMLNSGFLYLFPVLNVYFFCFFEQLIEFLLTKKITNMVSIEKAFAGQMPLLYRDVKNRLYSTLLYYLAKQIFEVIYYQLLF